MTKHFKT